MTDVVTVPAYSAPPPADPADFGLIPEEPRDFHRELNERRAKTENPEMLRRLRGL
jgi:hypothetical protein